MADGKIVQCIGAVVDVEFPRNAMPKVFDALKMEGSELTLEVQQQLGDGVVRTIALGSSDGLRRGNMVYNTDKPITVPVGKATLGRIMDVLGTPIDERGPVAQELTAPIHRKAPAYDELSPSQELLETGIKVIDLICPFAKGGKVGLFGGAGVRDREAAAQAVGRAERDGAHDAVAQLLLHFQRQRRAFHLQRVIHLGHLVARELHVHHGADALNDLALNCCFLSHHLLR